MRELDVLLERYLDRKYDELASDDKEAFSRLLDRDNDDLISWLIRGSMPDDERMARMVREIRNMGP